MTNASFTWTSHTSRLLCSGLLYCMEYLEDNLDEWLDEELQVCPLGHHLRQLRCIPRFPSWKPPPPPPWHDNVYSTILVSVYFLMEEEKQSEAGSSDHGPGILHWALRSAHSLCSLSARNYYSACLQEQMKLASACTSSAKRCCIYFSDKMQWPASFTPIVFFHVFAGSQGAEYQAWSLEIITAKMRQSYQHPNWKEACCLGIVITLKIAWGWLRFEL